MRKTLLLISLLLLASGAVAQEEMSVPVDEVELELGEELSYPLIIENPSDTPATYRVSGDTAMNGGEVSVTIEGDDRTSDQVNVRVDGGETRPVNVYYSGSACGSQVCTGTATFVARSLETDERSTASVELVVRRDSEVYGSPGITSIQAVVAGLLASIVSLFLS